MGFPGVASALSQWKDIGAPHPPSLYPVWYSPASNALVAANGSVFPITEVPALVFNDQTKAAANIAAINAAAALGGNISIDGVGVLYVSASAVGGPTPTAFLLGPSVVYTAVPATPNAPAFPAFRNFNFNPTRWAVTGITGSKVAVTGGGTAGRFVVAMAGHTLTAGQWLYLNGDTSENWNGFWKIESVVAGVSVTILTGFANPQTGFTVPNPTGSPLGCAADVDFQVIGGAIDMNFFNGGFTANGNYLDHAINVNNCFRARIETQTFNACKYGVCIQNASDPRVILGGQSYADGVHFYGPCWNPQALGLTGSWGDDGVILQTVDGPAYVAFMLPENGRAYPGGHIYGGRVENVAPTWTGNSAAVPLYPASGIGSTGGSGGGYTWPGGDLGYRFKGTQFIDVVGHTFNAITGSGFYSSYAVMIGNGYVVTTGFIENLVIRGLRYSDLGMRNTGGGLITIGQLVLEYPSTDTYSGYPLSTNMEQMAVKSMLVIGGNFKNTNTNSPNVITFVTSTCAINSLVFEQCIFAGGTGPSMYAFGLSANGGTLGTITFNQCYGLDGAYLVNLGANSLANTPRIIINGGEFTTSSGLIGIGNAQAADVYFNDVKVSSGAAQAALLNAFGSGKVRVYGKGAQFGGSAVPYLNLSSGTVCEWYVGDGSARVDVGLLALTKGQIGYHSSAVAGRNGAAQQGTFVGVDGAHFYALGTGASGINTLII